MKQRTFAREAVDGSAFTAWLRAGAVPDDLLDLSREIGDDAIEIKGNPNHDPVNGRFTFSPDGHRRAAAA